VLIASDGSPSARAALSTAGVMPWPRAAEVRGVVVAPFEWVRDRSPGVRRAFTRGFEGVADRARRALARRWPAARVPVVMGRAAAGILGEARRFDADVIVVGWRGHGAFRRALMGSVSRDIVERARRAVLVVRRSPGEIGRVVIGIDGSRSARRAVELAARLEGDGRSATVVRVVEPVALPTGGLLPGSVRAALLRSAATLNTQRMQRARRDVDAAAARLGRAGWRVRAVVRSGAPLATLLDIVGDAGCDLLVVGARGVRGIRRAVIGSVAAGALDRSPVPVLVVR
jgi:nucleotide-binding universal stress UspA family protein